MGKKSQSTAPKTGQAIYRSGPAEMDFAGRHWQIGVSQPMSDAEFAELQAHPHYPLFAFTYSADPDAAPLSEEN